MDKTDKNKNPIYAPVTLEFVTVALEYCSFIEKADEGTLFDFVDKATKLLPLLYLKAALLPPLEPDEEAELETTVTEAMYDDLRNRLSGLLGERDVFLDAFHEDMRYSDTPIATAISENLAYALQRHAHRVRHLGEPGGRVPGHWRLHRAFQAGERAGHAGGAGALRA